jgi:hypothetical protein
MNLDNTTGARATASPPTKTFVASNPKLIRKGTLVGSFDLAMPSGLIIRGAMLFSKADSQWVNFPSKEYTDATGVKKYYPLLEFESREVADKFQAAVVPIALTALLPRGRNAISDDDISF